MSKGNTEAAAPPAPDAAPEVPPVVTPEVAPAEVPKEKPAETPAKKSLLDDEEAEAPEGDEKKDDTPDDGSGAPEGYEAFEVPEGVEIDQNLLDRFTPLAKELELSQENAQKLVGMYAEVAAGQAAAAEEALLADVAKWEAEISKDPDHETTLADAKRALNRFTAEDPEAASFIKGSWVGSHPAVIRVLARAGALLREDGFPGNSGGGAPRTSSAKSMYKNSNMND